MQCRRNWSAGLDKCIDEYASETVSTHRGASGPRAQRPTKRVSTSSRLAFFRQGFDAHGQAGRCSIHSCSLSASDLVRDEWATMHNITHLTALATYVDQEIVPVRRAALVEEQNSVTCGGEENAPRASASALWNLDSPLYCTQRAPYLPSPEEPACWSPSRRAEADTSVD